MNTQRDFHVNTKHNHYYTPKPESKSRPAVISYAVKGITLQLSTDSGVFSKGQVDFGTDLLIRSIPPLTGSILDLGCGYGVVGIALACLNPAAVVYLSDINERAIALCKTNLQQNLQHPANNTTASANPMIESHRVFLSDGFAQITEQFNTIALNPPIRAGKATVFQLYHDAHQHLHNNGCLYIVIQKKQGMASSQSELTKIFGNCECLAHKSGYHILRSERRNA